MDFNLTVTIAGLDRLTALLERALDDLARPAGTIAYADRPDVGRVVDTPANKPAADASATAAFGIVPPAGGAVVPPTPPAPCIAAVAALPTAPVALMPGLPALPAGTVPSAPPPAAPAAALSVPAVPSSRAADGDLDSDGIPWDTRIHASTKNRNADGRWKKKKGTADTYYMQVAAELRQAIAARGGAVAPPLPQAPAAPTLAPVASPSAVPAAPSGGIKFAELALKWQAPMMAGTLTQAMISEALARVGLTGFNQLIHAPVHCPAVDAEWSMLLSMPVGPVQTS